MYGFRIDKYSAYIDDIIIIKYTIVERNEIEPAFFN